MLLKRIMDLSIILLTFPIWLPLMGLVGLLVFLRIGRPIFFVQERPGYRGELFKLVKFRTMRGDSTIPDEERLVPFGRWLRALSLDELPEIWNVLKGEMSLIGPRPLLTHYLPLYSPRQRRRHEVLPGLTGWAQIHGRNWVDWERRFELDVWYVDNRSGWLDLKILLKTIKLVCTKEGVSGHDSATMPEFRGVNTQSRMEPNPIPSSIHTDLD